MRRVLITIAGISRWAVINGLWAVARHKDYVPDKVYLVNRIGNEAEGERLAGTIEGLVRSYGKAPEIVHVKVDEKDFVRIGRKISSLIEQEKAEGNEVALDITPGRKAVVASALIAAREKQVDHVFYLYIEDAFMADKPYPMIPFQIQHSVDLEVDVWE